MLNVKQPSTLVNCAFNRLIDLLHFLINSSRQPDTDSSTVLREYFLSIPYNLFDQWAERLLVDSNRSKLKSNAHFLVFGPALTRLNIDSFPTLPVNITALCNCFSFSVNLKILCCRYAPFFWSTSDLLIFQNSVIHLRNLQRLILWNINLLDSPTFLDTIGTSCTSLKELDISYGKIPPSACKVISQKFPSLQVLKMKQRSEQFRSITVKNAIELLSSLLKLKVLDDDTTAWSCILPALQELSNENCEIHPHMYAHLEHLTIYQSLDINSKFTNMISSVFLDSKIFKQLPDENIADWLYNSFPALRCIDLRLENVRFSTIETFFKTKSIGAKIRSVNLSKVPLNAEHVIVIGKYAPNLKKLEIVNQRTLDTVNSDHYIAAVNNYLTGPLFCKLKHLSFTGMWDETISSLLLNNSTSLKELQIRPYTLPMQFFKHNPLRHLRRLVLDTSHMAWTTSTIHVCDLELDFLRRVLHNASSSLREIRLKSRPANEWESLCLQLKTVNLDMQILRPLM